MDLPQGRVLLQLLLTFTGNLVFLLRFRNVWWHLVMVHAAQPW